MGVKAPKTKRREETWQYMIGLSPHPHPPTEPLAVTHKIHFLHEWTALSFCLSTLTERERKEEAERHKGREKEKTERVLEREREREGPLISVNI